MPKSIQCLALLILLGGAGAAPMLAQDDAMLTYTPYSFTTLAGNLNGGGLVDGQNSVARFVNPAAIAVDASGTIYVADTFNYAVRKVTPSGLVSTLAGNGVAGHVDATGTSARFGPLKGIAVDGAGNIYVSDWGNPSGSAATLRKITSTGVVSTLVSSGLSLPQGIALDSSGNIYVADAGNAVIEKVTPTGTMTVFAGSLGNGGINDGAPGTGQLAFPVGLAFDHSGNLVITDTQLDNIRKASPTGALTSYAGSAGQPGEIDGALSSAKFTHPTGLASDSAGNLYLIDNGRLVREISAGGTVSTLGGALTLGSNDGAGVNALFNGANGLAASATGMVYVADTTNNLLRVGVSIANQPPTIQFQPAPETVNNGSNGAPLMVTVSGANVTYQWYLNGVAIPGATSASYPLSGVSADQAGTYTVIATNSNGSVTSNPAKLTVQTLGQIANLSTIDAVSPGQPLTAGFILTGVASKKILVRGIGPTLSAFNTANPLALPQLTLYPAGVTTPIASNTGWNNDPALIQAFNNTGAFLLPANSADTALLQTLASGLPAGTLGTSGYTAQVTSAGAGSGTALVEIYDDDLTNQDSQLTNISTISNVSPTLPLTVGFVIQGTSGVTLVIRAIGPTLSQLSVPTPLSQTTLTILDSNGNTLNANTGWGGSATLTADFAKVGAFALPVNSGDSALVVTLPAGRYSARATTANGTSGNALVEIYQYK